MTTSMSRIAAWSANIDERSYISVFVAHIPDWGSCIRTGGSMLRVCSWKCDGGARVDDAGTACGRHASRIARQQEVSRPPTVVPAAGVVRAPRCDIVCHGPWRVSPSQINDSWQRPALAGPAFFRQNSGELSEKVL